MREEYAMNDFLSDLIITKIYSVSTMYTEKIKRKRVRNNWCLGIKHEGETEYFCNGKKFVSNLNNIVLLPKGSSYEWSCTVPGHFSFIEFECDKECEDIFCFKVPNVDEILKRFVELEYNRNQKNSFYEIESISETYKIIVDLLKTLKKKYVSSRNFEKIQSAVDYINQNYTKHITNDELAKLTNFSTVYFRKLFSENFNMSPQAYVHTLRIRKAKELFHSDYGNISSVALSLGYSSIYDFSKTFKKYVGISPSAYVKNCIG